MRRESFLSMCTSIALAVMGFVICANNAMGADRYVRVDAANAAYPYATWATAHSNLADCAYGLTSNSTCWVSNGTYYITGTVQAKPTRTIRSVNGRDVTIIDGGGPASLTRG